MNFGWAPCKAREVWAGVVAKQNIRFGHVLVAARQGQRRDAVKKKGQRRDAVAAISLRRVRVVGETIAAGASPLTHICTVGACGTRPRRGPPAALPRKACDGMLGAMVRIAQPQVVGARFFVDSCKRFISIL